jgi:hypothetical protein
MNSTQPLRLLPTIALLVGIGVFVPPRAPSQDSGFNKHTKAGSTAGVVIASRVDLVFGESVRTLPIINGSDIEMLAGTYRDVTTTKNPDSAAQTNWQYRM